MMTPSLRTAFESHALRPGKHQTDMPPDMTAAWCRKPVFAPALRATLEWEGRFVLIGAMVLALAGCKGEPGKAPSPARSTAASSPAQETDQTSQATGFQEFSVEVTLSPAASARLAQGGETIVVSADYFGTPLPVARDQADDVGQLDLGRAQKEYAGEGRMVFDGREFRADRTELLDGQPQVNINVYSGRKTSDDNLLGCDFFQDTLRAAAAAQIALHCALIEEDVATENRSRSNNDP